ncbi:MAG: hypothetical protein AB1512_06565 [Thermodesulfobacteriota bacterium]
MLVAWAFLATLNAAQASMIWEGRDWGGADFAPAGGDILSGAFTNIGTFLIGEGDTVFAGSATVSLSAHDSLIEGALQGGTGQAPSLEIRALGNITLGGTLDRWRTVSLTSLGGSILLLDGSAVSTSGFGDPMSLRGNPGLSLEKSPGESGQIGAVGSISISTRGATLSQVSSDHPLMFTGGDLRILGDGSLELAGSALLLDNNLVVLPTPLPPSLVFLVSGLATAWLYGRRPWGFQTKRSCGMSW